MKKKRITMLAISCVLILSLLLSMGIGTFADEAVPEEEVPAIVPQETYETVYTDSYNFTDEYSAQALLNQAEAFPESYDMRNEGLVTSIKLQNPFGSCWAFAAIAAAETSLISAELADVDTINLSERHLAYFACTSIQDKNSSQYGEGFKDEGMSSSQKLNTGGTPIIASSVLATGAGPVEEGDDPDLIYQGHYGNIEYRTLPSGELSPFCFSSADDWTVPYERRNDSSYALKESYLLPTPAVVGKDGSYSYDPAATAAIKKQILDGHAVEIGFLADQASPGDDDITPHMLSDDWAQYGKYTQMANHAVTIVGWDDTIGSEESSVKFREDSNPITDGYGPGAWLVKNSWGSGEDEFPNKGTGTWGIPNEKGEGTGYFWLSYYDHSISSVEAISLEENQNYMIEQYDFMPSIEVHETGYDEEIKMANTFTASGNEVIKQISFFTTHPNTSVSYQIYLPSTGRPDTGLLVTEGTCGPYEFGGFHKVEIDPVILMYGQEFSVVITEKRSDGKYSAVVPLSDVTSFTGIINPGESQFFKDGVWNELSDSEARQALLNMGEEYSKVTADNFPIKVYTEPMEDLFFDVGLRGKLSLYFTPENSQSTVKLAATSYTGKPVPDLKAKWVLDENIYDISGHLIEKGRLVDITGLDEEGCGTKAVLKVRKEGDKYYTGQSNLYIYLYDAKTGDPLGTIARFVYANKQSMDGMVLADSAAKHTYNGSAHEPEVTVVDFAGNTMRKDLDYKLTYKDNINCGVATITATACGDYESKYPAEAFFAIQPAAAVLNKVTPGIGSLTLDVQDQSASGITGYQIQYRAEGTEEWTTKDIETTASTLTLYGLTPGQKYEVKVCGWLHIPDPSKYWDIQENYYGDFSQTLLSDPIASMEPGWNEAGGEKYYCDADGNLVKGWLQTEGKWYYLDAETGALLLGKANVYKEIDGNWYCQISGEPVAVCDRYTGFAPNENGWWYLEGGKVLFNKDDILYGKANSEADKGGEEGWWLLRGSKVINTETVAKNVNGWWYCKNGKVDFSYTGVKKNENGWWKIESGKVNFGFNGFASNEYGWWYLEGGKVLFNKDDILYGTANNEAGKEGEVGWWLLRGSKVMNTDLVAKNANGWWYCNAGKVDFTYTGVKNNEYGWWYCKNGKVDFTYTGIASNEFGTWFLRNGKVDFNYTGTYDGKAIINGRVIE